MVKNWYWPFVAVSTFALVVTILLSAKIRQVNRDEQVMISIIEQQRGVLLDAQNVIILQHNQRVMVSRVVRDLRGQLEKARRINAALAEHDAEATERGRALYNALRQRYAEEELYGMGLHTSERKH